MIKDSIHSYWEKDAFLQPWHLIIVGGGIVGLSAALSYRNSHPNARILVLDKGFLPEGASTRNAGFACIGSVSEHVADMEKESEENIKKRIVRRYRGLQLLRSTLGDQIIQYEASGGYELFTSTHKYEESARHIPEFNHWLRELVGEEEVYSASTLNGYPVIYNRLEGMLHPGRMMQELEHRVKQADIDIKWNCEVKRISEGQVELARGLILESDQVLIACNGFTPRLIPDIGITPGRGFVMVTEELQDLPWNGTFHYDRGYIYFRNLGKRLLIGGARNIAIEEEATDHFGVNTQIRNYLCEFVSDVLHLPEGWKTAYEWSGIMGFTDTKTPVLKRFNSKLVVAAGLSGMGVAIGMQIGREAARLLKSK